ncbi:acyl-CoA-binding domain-containing protein 7-like [Salvelinus sp. IW2-2015]|uniref:acyl-CoA-binding domain-containing protein 7-like n=1 Tax=Salvelinus sp. IW2-2015 TaxID=2691554 RepID=UPI000CEACD39|nr:acyl-CoA-binding domain-containing protein 7-like [Salvelinus alpinus]
MSLQAEFERVADDVKKVKSRPSDQELLDMYGLYKQAIFGDINIDKPGMLDMKGKAKWEAWDYRKGKIKIFSLLSECKKGIASTLAFHPLPLFQSLEHSNPVMNI